MSNELKRSINPKKLLKSKWTAINPKNREKHFLVSQVKFDEEGLVVECLLEAVLTKRCELIDWHGLKDTTNWQQGWL